MKAREIIGTAASRVDKVTITSLLTLVILIVLLALYSAELRASLGTQFTWLIFCAGALFASTVSSRLRAPALLVGAVAIGVFAGTWLPPTSSGWTSLGDAQPFVALFLALLIVWALAVVLFLKRTRAGYRVQP
jgi:lipopolysaccharide export LptBFGC system permease protein LptF